LLVDTDAPEAMNTWHQAYPDAQARAALPTVTVSSTDAGPDASDYPIKRPLKPSQVLQMLDQLVVNEASTDTGQTRKVLVVDDSLTVRKQVELELQTLGVGADCAANGAEALALLNSDTSYDLILLDVILPDDDGYSLCKNIKRDKRRKQTPVIMLTGKGSSWDRVRGKLSGCDTYLTKPVARELFQDTVNKYLTIASHDEAVIS
jgi:twitching motility two-component system response regulator PilG